jgi:hypothetical protein
VNAALTGCGKSDLFCHSERSEESLFDLSPRKEGEIPRFARNDKKVGAFSASSEACHTYYSTSLLLNQPAPPPNYSSTNFFLCLEGFKRLSGITRAAGGDPANSRARRLASPPAVNFLGLDLVLLLLIDGSCPDVSGAAHHPTISFAQSYGRGR